MFEMGQIKKRRTRRDRKNDALGICNNRQAARLDAKLSHFQQDQDTHAKRTGKK